MKLPILISLIFFSCTKPEIECKNLGWELRTYSGEEVIGIDTTYFGRECGPNKYDTTLQIICTDDTKGRWIYY